MFGTGSPLILPYGGAAKRSTTALATVGSKAYSTNGDEFTYVKAGASIAANDAVRLAGSALGYDDCRPTSAAGQLVFGGATAAFASGEYGYVQTKGVATIKVVVGTAAASPLMTNATAGTLAIADATAIAFRPAQALVTGVAAGSGVFLG
jgi:hypothetical protein